MNKKLLALLLAILMVAVSACAMAARNDGADGVTTSATENQATFEIQKTYTGTNRPNATFGFTISAGSFENSDKLPAGATIPVITANDIVITSTASESDVATATVNVPEASAYPCPGEYVYTITEDNDHVAGITYDTKSYKLTVTVYHDGEVLKRAVSIRPINNGTAGAKQEKAEFANSYAANENGLKLTKKLAGTTADTRDQFDFTVTINKTYTIGTDTYTITDAPGYPTSTANYTVTPSSSDTQFIYTITGLGHDEEVQFTNIPTGAVYTITETNVVGSITGKTYTSSINDATSGKNETTGTIAAGGSSVEVTNTLDEAIDTGVNTDNTPYILLMALVAIMALAFVAKKRSVRE